MAGKYQLILRPRRFRLRETTILGPWLGLGGIVLGGDLSSFHNIQVTARDLAETTKTTETSLLPIPRIPIRRIPPIFRRPPRVPNPRCCPPNNCRKDCTCCYSADEAMNADVQADTHN